MHLCKGSRIKHLRSAGVSSRARRAGGGGNITPPPANSRTCGRSEVGEAAIESAQRVLLKTTKKNLKKFWSKVNVRSKDKIVTFRLSGSRDETFHNYEPKLCQRASKMMKKVEYKYGAYNK